MCGIVSYFGGAGNSLTRVLTAMSAMIYRAPDSTGVAVFGDDFEPLRIRRTVGSVVDLVERLNQDELYRCSETDLLLLFAENDIEADWQDYQERLLGMEGLSIEFFQTVREGRASYPDYDELVDMAAENPRRLSPGWPGRPSLHYEKRVETETDLIELVQHLIENHDLSPVVIHSIVRNALQGSIAREEVIPGQDVTREDLLITFDRLFDDLMAEGNIFKLRSPEAAPISRHPQALDIIFQYLSKTPIRVATDYDRDGVRCVFRLLDATLLSRTSIIFGLSDALDTLMDTLWPKAKRPVSIDWRRLYTLEKAVNLYGWAAAAAMIYLQREEFSPVFISETQRRHLLSEASLVPGQTDPVSLRFFSPPIISHGRWAIQSPVNEKNAHPFTDANQLRAVALNGQFDGQIESSIREYLEDVAGYKLRSENSTEFLALLWGHYFDLLTTEQKKFEAIRLQVEAGLAHHSIGNQSVDFNLYQEIEGKSLHELDKMALIAAIKQFIPNGGQMAVTCLSLISPQTLYVVVHKRPAFIVRRLDNDDVMVVSDINAAMGLFPQKLIHDRAQELTRLARGKKCGQKEKKRLLEDFEVEVFHLDGEEIFAEIKTGIHNKVVSRTIHITDFDGLQTPEIDPFITTLNPIPVRKDFDRSFYETHMEEIPSRLREIMEFYRSEERQHPEIPFRGKYLRKRFGKGFDRLRRLVFIGNGSSYHIGQISQLFFHSLELDMDVLVLRPGDIEDVSDLIAADKDLVILLSWSSTTAEMVQMARRLNDLRVATVAITEKAFADMALVSRKSGGIMPIMSGEEITVSGVKSTICMLYCIHLLCLWVTSVKGHHHRIISHMDNLGRLPDILEQIIEDEEIDRFNRDMAPAFSDTRFTFVIDALNSTFVGKEVALKLEESSWSAISKIFDYRDADGLSILNKKIPGMVLVIASYHDRLDEAIDIMKKFHHLGIDFIAVSYPNRKQALIEKYSGKKCVFLPRLDWALQPFVELTFFYLFAFRFGLAHGRKAGTPPRNRAKSLTIAKSPPPKKRSEKLVLDQLRRQNEGFLQTETVEKRFQQKSEWECLAESDSERRYYRELRLFASELAGNNPLDSFYTYPREAINALTSAVFTDESDVEEILFIPFDRDAEAVARSFTDLWRPLLAYPARIARPSSLFNAVGETVLPIGMATRKPETIFFEKTIGLLPGTLFWIGPSMVPAWEKRFGADGWAFTFKHEGSAIKSEILFAGLNLVFGNAWQNMSEKKGSTLLRHIQFAAFPIMDILSHFELRRSTVEACKINFGYETAFVIGPPNGNGMAWVKYFDRYGSCVTEHHQFGASAHGPIVTVDSAVQDKFVKLTDRSEMVGYYSEKRVADWEMRYLGESDVDRFLSDPQLDHLIQHKKPFFAENDWYLPELRPDYDIARDNLIILDATSNRYFGQALDELAVYMCRYPRIIIITQESLVPGLNKTSLSSYPVSSLLLLPKGKNNRIETSISEFHLPFAINLVARCMASASHG